VSFPADVNLKRCLNEDPDKDGHPIATLNMELIKQLTRKMSPVDYLHVLQDPLLKEGAKKRKRKDGEDGGSGKKAKKVKLKI
jgi:DNA gyrase/topoisomerase IV subunit B